MRGAKLVLRRALDQRFLILAALLTAVFATTVLAALGGYASTVTGDGLRKTLTGASFAQVGARVTTTASGTGLAQAEQQVQKAIAKTYRGVPTTTSLSATGDSYVVPGQEHSQHPQLTTFAMYGGIQNHARLTAGRWPVTRAAGGVVETAVSTTSAQEMRLKAGETVKLHSRIDNSVVTVLVTGLFQLNRADDYVWDGDPLITKGVQRLDYTTFGPLVVTPQTFTARFADAVSARWLVYPSVQGIHSGQLNSVARRVRALPALLGTNTGFAAESSLPDLFTQLGQALLVARSTMLVPALQIVVLAGYALLLVSRLLTEHRRMEIALMRARGAAGGQVGALAIGEGVLLTIPAAVAAPLLAPPLLHAAAATPVLKTTGLHLEATPSAFTWGVAIVAAVACAAALTLPTLRGIAQSYVATASARGRGERRGLVQRAGLDLALVVIAALGIWQLSRYGAPVTTNTTSGGGLGIDPFIVAGPALALLAGGVLMLRLVPLVSRGAEQFTARGRGFAPAMGARQVSRRPLRYAGPALLLVMAVAVGVLSVTTGVTWRQSQIDQADFQSGVDLRLTPPTTTNGPSTFGQGGRYAALPGVTAASPVRRDQVTVGQGDATLLAVDATKVHGMLTTHSDLTSLLAAGGAAKLTSGRADPPTTWIPGRPDRLAFGLRLSAPGNQATLSQTFRASVLVVDGLGVPHEMDLGNLTPDGTTRTAGVDLSSMTGPGGMISYPIGVRGFRFSYGEALGSTPLTFSVTSVRGSTAGRTGPSLARPGQAGWSGYITAFSGMNGDPSFADNGGFLTVRLPVVDRLDLTLGTALVLSALLTPPHAPPPTVDDTGAIIAAPIPAIITSDLAASAHVAVGGKLNFIGNYGAQPVTVAGIVRALPSGTAGLPGILVDWSAFADQPLVASGTSVVPNEFWLSTRNGVTAPAAAELSRNPSWTSGIADRNALRHQLLSAPLGGEMQGALLLGFGAALAFAVIGFAVNAAVSTRERLTEFAILRALGAAPRQVFGLVAVEQAFLVGLGLIGGTVLGVLVADLVVPHIVLTVRATAPYPPVHLMLPWPTILALLGSTIVFLGIVLALLVWSLRRGGLGRTVRLGEDR
jgi:FtsX-like permease family